MTALRIGIFAIIVVTTIVLLLNNTDRWAAGIQRYYIRHDKNNLGGWEQSWVLTLFKVLVVFAGFVFLSLAFSFCLGSIYF